MQYFRMERRFVNTSLRAALWLASGIAVGAISTYLLDPSSGRRRRAFIKEKVSSRSLAMKKKISRETEDIWNRVYGSIAEAKKRMKSEKIDDETLNERIRSEFGRSTRHSKAIKTKVAGGVVTVSGKIAEEEFDDVIQCIKGVPGVLNLINNLEVQKNT